MEILHGTGVVRVEEIEEIILFSDFSLLLLPSSFPPLPFLPFLSFPLPPFLCPPLFFFPFLVLTFEPRVSHIAGEPSTTESHPQLSLSSLSEFPGMLSHDFYKNALS